MCVAAGDEDMWPGISIFDLRTIAFEVMQASELTDDNGEKLGQYFIHGLGHHLGLDAHDPGSDEALLVPGNVITNEPGIYIPDEARGIRIENDFLVTASGSENLSAALPVATAGGRSRAVLLFSVDDDGTR